MIGRVRGPLKIYKELAESAIPSSFTSTFTITTTAAAAATSHPVPADSTLKVLQQHQLLSSNIYCNMATFKSAFLLPLLLAPISFSSPLPVPVYGPPPCDQHTTYSVSSTGQVNGASFTAGVSVPGGMLTFLALVFPLSPNRSLADLPF